MGAEPALPANANGHARSRPWGERLKSVFRGIAIEAAGRLRTPPGQSAVHIARSGDYQGDLTGILQRQYASFREHVPLAGKRIVLKPNLVEYHRDKVINTNPNVVAAVIELCQREGAASGTPWALRRCSAHPRRRKLAHRRGRQLQASVARN